MLAARILIAASIFLFIKAIDINLRNTQYLRTVPKQFLSFAIGSSLLSFKNLHKLNLTKAAILAKALSPAYLRIGGNEADNVTFVLEESDCRNVSQICLTGKLWDKLNKFAIASDAVILMDLNALLGRPNIMEHLYNTTIEPKQLAFDYSKLRILMSKFDRYRHSQLIGPSVTNPLKLKSHAYLKSFLQRDNSTTAISFHSYYMSGHGATIEDFLNISILNTLELEIREAKRLVSTYAHRLNKPIWLGETSSASGGGAHNLSDAYVAGFLWLDKLGVAAREGIDVVIRQTLYWDSYALLDKHTMPSTDYWLSVVYKLVVGEKVVKLDFVGPETLRLYAGCSKRSKSHVVLYGFHFGTTPVSLNLGDSTLSIREFSLSPDNGNLQSKIVWLNGEKLQLNGDKLPKIKGKLHRTSRLQLPPKVLVFYEIRFPLRFCL